MNPNSNSNDKATSMKGFQEGMRGVDREDNPTGFPERARRKSWSERLRETIGFSTEQPAQQQMQDQQQRITDKRQQLQSTLESALESTKDSIDSTSSGRAAHRRGSDILDEVNKAAARRAIGGSQLFDSPVGTNRESTAANGFLTKYANESAPGENSA
ncbi:hypothetical protein DRE_03284 [Drechslerella stenobrocha 248]|uniref:Uncharacterized protein n=1 Tax=Drechslerella stenobrocha 248 TaxID=1043628 RepID=W7HVW1_9PEZI|nr:hypothetical protein DRE_03284 [Drechslerella stenobrocha 248]